MQTLPPALFIVLLELTVGSFVCLYALDLRGDSSRNFVIFQGALYIIFAALTLGAMNAFASPAVMRGLGLDTGWLDAQGTLVLVFSVLLLPWNVLLWLDRQPRKGQKPRRRQRPAASAASEEEAELTPLSDMAAEDGPASPKKPRTPADVTLKPLFKLPGVGTITIREIRFALGGLISALGLAAVFVVGMAYRTLADSRLDGAFLVGAFVLGALALGGVMTAMLLGHWYLNTPTASGKPLEFVTSLMIGALVLELVFSLLIGPSTAHPTLHTTTVTPGTTIQAGPGGQIIVTTPTTGSTGATTGKGSIGGMRSATPTPATTGTGSPSTPSHQVVADRQAPLSVGVLAILQYLLGFVSSLILGAVALYLTRGRSFQSATGMLYLCVSFVFIGEIIGRALLLLPIF